MALSDKTRKPAEGLLVGLLAEKPKSERPEPKDSEMESEGPDWELLGQEVLDAIDSKDASALAEAVKALVAASSEDD